MQNLKIIFEDDSILVLDKPPGLVVDRSETQKVPTLEDWLRENYDTLVYHNKNIPERMGIVHRLDKDTSGVLLVGKTQEVLENLQIQFKERKTKKEYLALVHGLMEGGGVVDAAIGRNLKNREKFTVSLQGDALEARWAVTKYEPLERLQFTGDRLQQIFSDFNKIQMHKLSTIHYNLYTLLRCHPLTGRTHQIRVHLKYIGHPIVGDEKYAGRKIYRLDHRWCPRQFLHAHKLGFRHPVSGKWMEFESPLADDLEKALSKLSS